MRNSSDDEADGAISGVGPAIDFGLALVVGSSPVNRVVVSRIGERAGLRTQNATPQQALAALSGPLPALVILDGGADGREGDAVIAHLAPLRRPVSGRLAPLVILLSGHHPETPPADVDAVVAKPIIPDRLQPVIHDLIGHLRT